MPPSFFVLYTTNFPFFFSQEREEEESGVQRSSVSGVLCVVECVKLTLRKAEDTTEEEAEETAPISLIKGGSDSIPYKEVAVLKQDPLNVSLQ